MCNDYICRYKLPDGICNYEPSENVGYGCLYEECAVYSDCEKCIDWECLNKAGSKE